MDGFTEADKKEHKVEDQWHYPILTKYGFIAITKIGIGFVRSYTYMKGEHEIVCTTGCSADYWRDKTKGGGGYWGELEKHLILFGN